MDDKQRRDVLIPLWQQWTSNLPPREHLIFEFHREVVETLEIDSDLLQTYGVIVEYLYPTRP